MKWYSVKKYAPQLSTNYIIFTENNYAHIARLEDKETPNIWIRDDYHYGDCGCGGDEKIYGITHFAMIEPVEIEE